MDLQKFLILTKKNLMIPVAGVEPTLLTEHDFESCASANSATPARSWRRQPDSNRWIKVLQTLALPLGYAAKYLNFLERKTGFEPATPTLARWCSTTELLPHEMAGVLGFEPRRDGIKIRCLTALLYPNIIFIL